MQTKTFFPTKQTRIVALFFGDFLVSLGSCFGYDPTLFGRAEIWKIFGWHFWRNDDLINSFWIKVTFRNFLGTFNRQFFFGFWIITHSKIELPLPFSQHLGKNNPAYSAGRLIKNRRYNQNMRTKLFSRRIGMWNFTHLQLIQNFVLPTFQFCLRIREIWKFKI